MFKCVTFILIMLFFTSWGFRAHRGINVQAINYIPNAELFKFYKSHRNYIKEHAVDADIRKFSCHAEIPAHYIDLDYFEIEAPLDTIIREKAEAFTFYGDSLLNKTGKLPWVLEEVYQKLVFAFKENNLKKILRHSADIGHYMADAHVPLHTVKNYNGQLSNQHGIHGLWETQIPNLFLDTLILSFGDVQYISNVQDTIWQVLEESFAQSKVLLTEELKLRQTFGGEIFQVNETNRIQFTQAYCEELQEKLSLKVWKRYKTSCRRVSAIWYSAWIDAGQPHLDYD